MNAFYLIDKPLGITSFDVIRILRKKLNIKRIWHTWTLDPLATWGLLIATWNYTKLIPFFEKDNKTYEFEISFDWVSDSYDLWTEVRYLSEEEKKYFSWEITKEKISEILRNNFSWEISQVPPKYSALKINWKKALEKVKSWEEFELKPRICNIFEIELLEFFYPRALFRAKVSAGTYIRSIANDFWKIIWSWAYVTKLRRTSVWSLDISLWQDLEYFDFTKKLDLKNIFKNRQFITLEEEILKKLNNWLCVFWNFDLKKNEEIFVFDKKNVTNIVFYDWEKLITKRKI